MWREDFVPILQRRLEIRPGQTIVDVGCGTGFFSRLLARGLVGGSIIGIDRNERLIQVARKLAADEGLKDIVRFREGNAESIPLADDTADRVVCQTLLWILKEPRSVLREMIRVCKPGGLVGAVEGAFDHVIWYVPDDPHLTSLYQRWVVSYAQGHRKLYGSDRGIGYKLPTVFHELGLKRIRMDGFPYVWTESDDRVPKQFRLEEHKLYVHRYESGEEREQQENKRILKLGGMTAKEFGEMRRLSYERSGRILRNPSLLDRDFCMNAGLFLLTTGVKE